MTDWKHMILAAAVGALMSAPAFAADNAADRTSGTAGESAQATNDSTPAVTFDQADTDKSGGLDENELGSALYTSADTDGSATLEEQEYAHGHPLFGEVDLSKYDANGDGSIDKDEFDKSYMEAATFKNADKDGNGMVSSDEYLAMYNDY